MRCPLRLLAPLLLAVLCVEIRAEPVTIGRDDSGGFVLLRDGQPYRIKGAGGHDHLDTLVEHGGNSIRTWGIETLEEEVDGKPLLDRCHELGISVTAGIWIGHERHGFDYGNSEQVEGQRNAVREAVRKYRDHPALLMWGLGNEMEGPTSDGNVPHVWKELNELARIVKAEDPDHPVMTVIAGASPVRVRGILEHYPEIDVLGVNAYAGAAGVADALKSVGWEKPFVLAEFGPTGHWEVEKTPWGASIEPSSREKASRYFATKSLLEEEAGGLSLGSYCFVWGQKQETTATWYGMFLPSGEKLPSVDAMARAWTGEWPANRCPRVESFESELKNAVVAPGRLVTARATARDPEGDSLDWKWLVAAESTDIRAGGDAEAVPPSFPDLVVEADDEQVVIRTPSEPGAYRLFLTVRDGEGAASVENLCFRVEEPSDGP